MEPYQWTSVLGILAQMDPGQLVTRQAFEKRMRTREWDWAVAQRSPLANDDPPQGSPWLSFTDGAKAEVARFALAAWVGEFSLAHMHANDVVRLWDSAERGARCRMYRTLFDTLVAQPELWQSFARTLKAERPLAEVEERIFDMPF